VGGFEAILWESVDFSCMFILRFYKLECSIVYIYEK
jgi:hypothetical protein